MKFNGMILQDTREAFNMSRRDLADKLGVSEQSVWQYETGVSFPKFEVINSLKRVFGVELSYFQKDISNPKIVRNSQVAYRASLRGSMKNTKRETLYLSVIDSFLNELLNYVTLPEPAILSLSNKVIKLKLNGASLDEVASYVRKNLKIDSNNNFMMASIEKSGVFILERSLNDNVDAYSAWTDNNRPYIILGTEKKGPRRLFDLAHELGHVLLHRNLEFDAPETTPISRSLEKEANEFAASFTLPKSEFTKLFLNNVKDPTNPKDYLELKEYFQMSIAALEMRAHRLKLISKEQSSRFWARMNKFGFKKEEPLDEKIPFYVPGKIYAIFNSLSRRQLQSLYNKTGVSRKYINDLIIPNAEDRVTFMKTDDVYAKKGNIIPISR
ncbi:helix-turn-helix domain-containing protein [Pediococcus pentosaceus]|uniref:spr1629 family repressor/antitoxin n=1 Tax=Pediococcus pentosaceus TaxID=1255 RepID=UPI0003C33BAA|nr:XRE family transcriptional regulator [Pediococcus pentosaceus]AHA05121.1 DNA-binding protein [Pediococcus pentosaceus SL4]